MALSPNYGWAEPDNSSLVKNGAQDIRALGDAIDTSVWNVGYGQAGKNKIINGDFGVWQRGTSFAAIASGAFAADRWQMGNNGTGAATISQQTFTPGTAPVAGYEGTYFIRQAITSVGTSTRISVRQPIEDVRTFANQTVTVSFWAKADAARTIEFRLNQQFGSGGSAGVQTTTYSFSATTSWQRFSQSLTIPSVSGATIGTGSSLLLSIFNDTGSTSTMDIWGVQIEAGSVATAFQTATGTLQGELAACQRYYYRNAANTAFTVLSTLGAAETATSCRFTIQHPVTMRIAPTTIDFSTLAVYSPSGGTNSTISTFANVYAGTQVNLVAAGVTGLTANAVYMLYSNNSTSAYFGFSAEL